MDTLTNVDLLDYYHYHQKNDALASLLVRHRPGSRYFLFDQSRRLSGWENVVTHEKIISRRQSEDLEQIAFSCLHVIDPKIFDFLEEEGCFSIIDVYLRLSKNHKIMGFLDDESYWLDIGTPEKLQRAEQDLDFSKFILKS